MPLIVERNAGLVVEVTDGDTLGNAVIRLAYAVAALACELGAWEWAWVDLNYRPHAYQACALTT